MDFEELRRCRSLFHQQQDPLLAPIESHRLTGLGHRKPLPGGFAGLEAARLPLLDTWLAAALSLVFRSGAYPNGVFSQTRFADRLLDAGAMLIEEMCDQRTIPIVNRALCPNHGKCATTRNGGTLHTIDAPCRRQNIS